VRNGASSPRRCRLVRLMGSSRSPLSHRVRALSLETSAQNIKLIVALRSPHIACLLVHVLRYNDGGNHDCHNCCNWLQSLALVAINRCIFFANPLARAIRGQSQCLRNGLGTAEVRERCPSSKARNISKGGMCLGPFLQAFCLKALVPSWHKTSLIVGVFSLPKKVEL
jgi:hypothetical protein